MDRGLLSISHVAQTLYSCTYPTVALTLRFQVPKDLVFGFWVVISNYSAGF